MSPDCSPATMFITVFCTKVLALVAYFVGKSVLPQSGMAEVVLFGLISGLFIYISTSDVVPEEMEAAGNDPMLVKYLVYVAGIALILSSSLFGQEHHQHH